MLRNRVVPWLVVISTLVLVLINDEVLLRRDFCSWPGAQGWGASTGCEDPSGRATALRAAVERVRLVKGPLFVSGNLLPWLAERDDVYAFGGPQPDTLVPRVVLLERPPCGDTWARPLAEREALYSRWKAADVTVLVDDDFVFAAERVEPLTPTLSPLRRERE